MYNDEFIGQLLDEGKIRPKTGHLWAEKLNNRATLFSLGKHGMVEGELRPSGLVVPNMLTTESLAVLAQTYVVRALGPTPLKWEFRFFDKEFDHKTSWSEQRIEVGTVIGCRAVNGINQDKRSNYIELRYDEICLIGGPVEEGDDFPSFYPAPGWVVIEVLNEENNQKGIILNAAINNVLSIGHIVRGRVYSLPRNTNSDLNIGDIVFAPLHSGSGATEWVEVDNYRILPLDDLLGVEVN